MATTMTGPATGELTTFHFPIVKTTETDEVNPVDGTPDVIIWGKATDGAVDGDLQIVDPEWSGPALQKWLATGGNVRASHDPHQEVGRGLEVELTPDGHWVKALIVDPLAKHKVRKGVLRDYSVGVAFPDIKRDPTGKALNGVIGGNEHTQICELSIVGRGSNPNSGFSQVMKMQRFQLAKSLDGVAQYVGAMVEGDDETELVTVQVPRTAQIKFSPADLKKLLDRRIEKRDFDPNVGGGVDRDQIPAEDFAGPDRSFPIVKPGDVADIAPNLNHTKHDPEQVKRRAMEIAHRKGPEFEAQIPDSWKDGPRTDTDETTEKALPDRKGLQCKDCKRFNKPGASSCAGCGKSLPQDDDKDGTPDAEQDDAEKAAAGGTAKGARAQKPDDSDDGDDGDSDDDDSEMDDDDSDEDDEEGDSADKSLFPAQPAPPAVRKGKMTCTKCGGVMKAKHAFCPGCGTAVAKTKSAKVKAQKAAGGRTRPTPGDGVVGEDTAPVPAHREPDGPAVEAFEADAKLPTDPDTEYKTLLRQDGLGVSPELGALHDQLCAAYHPETSKAAHPLAAPLHEIDDLPWQQKAFEAAAGGTMQELETANGLWQHACTIKGTDADVLADLQYEAHKSFQDANPGPGTFPTPAHITAGQFNRPYQSAGRARQSMQATGPNSGPGGFRDIAAQDFDRDFLTAGRAADSPANKAADRGVSVPAPGAPSRVYYTRMQRDNAVQAMRAMHDHIAQTFPDLCPMRADNGSEGGVTQPNPSADAVAEPAAKTTAPAAPQLPEGAPVIAKAVVTGFDPGAELELLMKSAVPTLVKAAVQDAVIPLRQELEATRADLADTRRLNKALRKRVSALESEPDPRDVPFRGMGVRAGIESILTKSSARGGTPPAGVAEQAQAGMLALLNERYQQQNDPAEREATLREMFKIQGITQ